MSSMLNKIADAVTGHHHNTAATGAPLGTTATGAPLGTTAAPTGNAIGGVGSNYAGTNYSATNNGALKEGAQVRDTGMASTHSTLAHGTAGSTTSGAMKGAAAGTLAGHPAAGAALGAAAGHHAATHGTSSHLGSSSSSSMHSSNAGALGTGAALGSSHLGSSHVGSSHLATGTHTQGAGVLSHDNAMTRSEEHLLVGKEKVNVGQAALHKYVTTEHVATAVPIIKERAVVEREPITEANRGAALSGPDFKEAHYEVNLMEERAVAEKEAVPIERVRLRKEVEQTQQYVEADLRKEHIEIVDGTQGKGLAHGAAGAIGAAAKTLESSHHNTQLGHSNLGATNATTDATRRL